MSYNRLPVVGHVKNIKNKNLHLFTIFDIQELLSILLKIFWKIQFYLCKHQQVSALTILKQSSTLEGLYCLIIEPWIKEDGNGDFDVILRSHDRAEVYELVWFLMLNELPKRLDKENIGLCRW